MDIEKIIKEYNLEKELVNIRRYIHEHPEISEEENETQKFIMNKLDSWGIEYKKIADTGVLAFIKGKKEGKVVALRADIDALPIEEETGLNFASKNKGVMHACGHDAHITIGLIVAFIIEKIKDELTGTVKFFFQPAEETVGGADRMIQEGCMENPTVDYVLGLHVEPKYDTGNVGIRYGKMYAASDMIDIDIYGKGSHGAHPDEGIDAIVVASNIINTIQTVASRNTSPLNSCVCSIGLINGGNVRNQIADHVHMEGIIRTLDPDMRLNARKRIGDIVNKISESMGAKADYKVTESYGPLINDDKIVDIAKNNAIKLLGEEHVIIEKDPDLSVEDFSYFALKKPACYFHLGCYNETNGPRIDLHNSTFTIDENCLIIGVRLQLANIITLLNER